MKTFIKLILSTLLFSTLSFHLNGQSILNGGFENNTFSPMCQNGMTGSTYNSQISNIVAYGSANHNDIIYKFSCYPPNTGDWNGAVAYFNSFGAGVTGFMSLAFELSSTVTSGNQYTLTFYDKAILQSTPPFILGTVSVGISETPASDGTNIGTALPIQNVWTQRSFSFTAPFSGTAYITATVLAHNEVGNVAWVHIDDFALEAVLPVELSFFNGNQSAGKVALNWATASEQNNKGFEIQKSKTGLDWETLGFVDGKGTADGFNAYEFIDRNPFSGENYYRLKQLDIDGKFSFSNIISIKTAQRENDIQIYPNPTTGKIEITGVTLGTVTIRNSIGSKVREAILPNQNIDISALPGGIYFVSIHAANQLITKLIIKQ